VKSRKHYVPAVVALGVAAMVASIAAAKPPKRTTAANDQYSQVPQVGGPEIWKDPAKEPAQRAADLIDRMSIAERIGQIQMSAPAIPRLAIPAYDWWNECLHGVARAGHATVFPQAVAAAATWDPELWQRAATVMSDEGRAKHHQYARQHGGASIRYFGLDAWSPNVNIFRDPRWGRGHETYGEDPYLTGRMGVAFVRGLQGDDPRFLKMIATPKHFAVHSGPESLRHVFDARISDQDLWETYLPAFEACFREGHAYSVMGAYNRFRGESCSASHLLLIDILRGRWGFKGYSVSDVDSVHDIFATHHLVKDAAAAAALAIRNGLDLNSGNTYAALPQALTRGLVSVADIDRAAARVMEARIRLGMFDPPSLVKYAQIPASVNDSAEHDALSLTVARETMVLLKNAGGVLPLAKRGTVAVIGPNADDPAVLVGNYNGDPSHPVTVLAGIRQKLAGKAKVLYAKGCELRGGSAKQTVEALAVAKQSDAVVMVLGLNGRIEGEEGEGGDRASLSLLPPQQKLLEAVAATGKPLVLVVMAGSSMSLGWAQEHVPAILEAWYPGQRGGDAVADVLFGDYNPAGRLPVTFYQSERDLPPFADYAMKGRTYRYFTGEPLFPFGYGLSYTTFAYADLHVTAGDGDSRLVQVRVTNTGPRAGDEVVELYVHRKDMVAEEGLPLLALRGFKRVHLEAGASTTVRFRLAPFLFAFVNKQGVRTVEAAEYVIGVGGSQTPAQTATVRFHKRIVDPPYACP
jgi:beta-glucosidase